MPRRPAVINAITDALGHEEIAMPATPLGGVARSAKGRAEAGGRVEETEMANAPTPVIAIPKGGVLPWFSQDKEPPRGWKLCDGLEGRPNFNGIWMVGTDDPKAVGQVINLNPIAISLSGSADPTATQNKYPVSSHAGDPPHAPGMDHAHAVSVSGTFPDRNVFAPPSMQIRYIIKID